MKKERQILNLKICNKYCNVTDKPCHGCYNEPMYEYYRKKYGIKMKRRMTVQEFSEVTQLRQLNKCPYKLEQLIMKGKYSNRSK